MRRKKQNQTNIKNSEIMMNVIIKFLGLKFSQILEKCSTVQDRTITNNQNLNVYKVNTS